MTTKFNPYLSFNGNCEQAFGFYKTVFGGDFKKLARFNDMQSEEGAPAPSEEFGNQIRHIELPMNNDTVLMGSDSTDKTNVNLVIGNNVKISITTDCKEEGERLFHALSDGGTVKIAFSKSFWGSFYGSLIDKFGIHWLIEAAEANEDHSKEFEDNANIHIP